MTRFPMRLLSVLPLCALLGGCATLSTITAPTRDGLWRQAHHAMRQDSVAIAIAAFQRLAAEHPETTEGREARFFLGTLYLEPREGTFDAERALHHLQAYVEVDSARAGRRPIRRPEARTLRTLAREATLPCGQRTGPLRCDPAVVVQTRVTGGDTVVVRTGDGGDVARLRQQLAERDATIRQLREELQRIRNTLAPRP
jgi:hypothetical protein